MYCGQTLALPLLSCCNFMYEMPEDKMSQHHEHTTMTMGSDEHQMVSDNVESNCNYHCNFCGFASIVLIEVTNLNQPTFNESKNSFYNFSVHSTSIDTLFRPPITA